MPEATEEKKSEDVTEEETPRQSSDFVEDLREGAAVGSKPYWFGVLPKAKLDGELIDTPFQNMQMGPLTFMRWSDRVFKKDESILDSREQRDGWVRFLTDDDIVEAKKAIKKHVVSKRGAKMVLRCKTMPKGRKFRPRNGDIPLGRFLYLEALEEPVIYHPRIGAEPAASME